MSNVMKRPQHCRLCGSKIDSVEVVGDSVYAGNADQKFYHCTQCDVAFLYPPLTEAQETQFYNNEFEKFMETRAGGDYDWSGPAAHIQSNAKQYGRRYPFFAEFTAEGKSVLEIGCSSGFMLLPLKEMGMKVCGVEPSGGFTSFLQSKEVPVYPTLTSLSETQPEASFDIVMHFFVLEHVRKPVEFLTQAFEFVKPGGCMVFEVPSRSDPLISIFNIPSFHKFYWTVAHNYYFNRPSLEYVLRQVTTNYTIMNEQRYDLSNHMTWAIQGKSGGQEKYSTFFTSDLERAYKQSMIMTGYCDTLVCRLKKITNMEVP